MRIISGSLKNRRLVEGPARSTRPTTDLVRGALFNILQSRTDGSRFLDLFAGTGAVGLEAWSRGAEEVVWVEFDGKAYAACKANVNALAPEAAPGLQRARAKDYLEREGAAFDVIFADPPYAKDLSELMPLIARRLAPGGIFVAEHKTGEAPATGGALEATFTKTYGGSALSGFVPATVAPDAENSESP